MKWLVRTKLAPRLRIRVPAKTPTPSAVCSKKISNDARDFQGDGLQLQDTAMGTTDKLLMEIRDLLQMRIRTKADDTDKSDEDEENKNDWKLAAAVIDRILLIIFSILLIGGMIVFFLIFVIIYFSPG